VHLNGNRAKPSRTLRPGDELRIRKGEQEFVVQVKALSEHRGPAKAAALLYEETEASRRAREAQAEARRLTQASGAAPSHRPDKRDRRQIRRFTGRN
jgi:ribosome-associated heat shock protein Hsp15